MAWAVVAIGLVAACASAGIGEPAIIESTSGFGPLWDTLMLVDGRRPDESPEDAQRRSEADFIAREEWIAGCMHEQGFPYIASLALAPRQTTVVSTITVDRESRQFAERYGFGISDDVESDGWTILSHGDDAAVDPNQELISEMSNQERQAWFEALNGLPQPQGEWDPELAGCQGQASILFDPSDDFAALHTEINNFFIASDSAPQIVELNAEWASCMFDKGFSGSQSPNDLVTALQDEFTVLSGGEVFIDANGVRSATFARAADGSRIGPDPETRALFAERELAAAVASWDCRNELNYDLRHQQLDWAQQHEFVQQNRAELDALIAHAEQQRANR